MKWLRSTKMLFVALCAIWVLGFYVGCEKDTDGPLSATYSDDVFAGKGYFLSASLDSGKAIHLVGDTLYLQLGKMWTFSNCALKSINLGFSRTDSVGWIKPDIDILVTDKDCSAPYYRPDTLIKLIVRDEDVRGVGMLKVQNDADSVLDSILVRRGSLSKDTFFIYMDSSFADAHNYPLRTKGKDKLGQPTIIRVLDSLTPREFYWRAMKSTCTYRIDMCKNVVPDTIYPTSWNLSDTNLVPVHYACADTDSVYCTKNKWENDSTDLGELQVRPDTIWHYSTYYMEKIPKCGTFAAFATAYYGVGQRVRFIRQLFSPGEDETFCGPSTGSQWMLYNLSGNKMVVDSLGRLDSLIKVWKNADIAPDTLIVDSAASKK